MFDEPTVLGGLDTAANPVEQLLSSLGACIAIGVAANATLHGVKIGKLLSPPSSLGTLIYDTQKDSLSIDVSGPIDLHTFLGLNATGNAGFKNINVGINLKSASSTPEQIAKVIQSSTSTSPVGHTLERAISVKYTNGAARATVAATTATTTTTTAAAAQ